MDIMTFMEVMGTHEIAIVAAFFIGLMVAISPCPLATNITAVAYISKRLGSRRHTLKIGLIYALGRMLTYVIIASLVVWIGLGVQSISLPLQKYGDMSIGPLLVIIGIVMLDIVKIRFLKGSRRIESLKEYLSRRGVLGSFLMGAIFALAFCPFSAVLFFGMLIPLAINAGDGIIIPSVFSIATALPVIVLSMVLVHSFSKLGTVMNRLQTFEKWMRRSVAIVFIAVGAYYTIIVNFG
jgi:cytochrome c biogenesis protein CcdA